MKAKLVDLSKLSSFKIVLVYALVSFIYIYTSDYFLHLIIKDIELFRKIETQKGFVFIVLTSTLLYYIIKRNLVSTTSQYQKIIDVQNESDQKLEESNEEYMSLFNQSPIPMWIFELDTYKFLLINDAACVHYGYSQEEFKAITLKDIRPIEDVHLLEEFVSISIKNNHYQIPEPIRHTKKNGDTLLVKIKNSAVKFHGKEARLALLIDVTAEVEIQSQLKKSNERLRVASEIANLGYWSHNLLTSKVQWSDELHRIFETDPKTFIPTFSTIQKFFYPENQLSNNIDLFEKFEADQLNEVESKIYTAKGKTKWIFERQYLVRDADNRPIRLEGIAIDITKPKLHEQQLFESNERFKMIAKATVEAIIDWDITNKTVFWGEGFNTIFGYDIDSANKHLWEDNIHPEDKEKVLIELQSCLYNPKKQLFNSEFRFVKANGQIAFVQLRGILIRNSIGNATRALGAMVDLTETIERMRKIESQNKTLTEISWTQSHIVRAPLANLIGLVSLLKDSSNLDQDDKELLNFIDESADKLDQIIREIVRKSG